MDQGGFTNEEIFSQLKENTQAEAEHTTQKYYNIKFTMYR